MKLTCLNTVCSVTASVHSPCVPQEPTLLTTFYMHSGNISPCFCDVAIPQANEVAVKRVKFEINLSVLKVSIINCWLQQNTSTKPFPSSLLLALAFTMFKTATQISISWTTELFLFYMVILKLNNKVGSVGLGTRKQQNCLFLCWVQNNPLEKFSGFFPSLCESWCNI